MPGILQGKVAIVTGSGSPKGLGRSMAIALARAGARVALADVHEESLQDAVNETLEAGGEGSAIGVLTDVSNPKSAADAVEQTIAKLGSVHMLVNNAGINPHTLSGGGKPLVFYEDSPETWAKVVSVNLNGPFHMAQAVVPHLIRQGWGRIVGVTTSLDTMIRGHTSPYGPTKAGHEALVATMASDLFGTGVTANVLIPGGATDTNMIPDDAPVDRTALLRPEVMQSPIVWLASDDSGDVTGKRIIATDWDDGLAIEKRLEKAASPAAWSQLSRPAGLQGIPGQAGQWFNR